MAPTYISKVPRKWRLITLIVFLLFIFVQTWNIKNTSAPPTTASIKPETEKKKSYQNGDGIKLAPPRKQSLLNGFGGFLSSLPQMQHDFEPEPLEYTKLREERRLAVKEAFLHGWNGYKKYALGHDELKPLSNGSRNPFGGWGATLVDSLSTMYVMELDNEAAKLMPRINKIGFKIDEDVSVFESIIRYLGGLLSAFELSDRKHEMLLQKADKLAQELLPAFDTPSGLPYKLWNPARNETKRKDVLFAEVATVQLEFMMLSQLTGNPIYGQKAQAITDYLDNMGYEHGIYIKGLYPTEMDPVQGRFKDETSRFGAMGDSGFEYFLKEHLLMDGTVPQYGRMYTESINAMKQYMLQQIPGHGMLLLPPFNTQSRTAKKQMDHLTCFVPGMLAMGSKTFNVPEDLEIAKGLMETCVYMYRTTTTGLGGDVWQITDTQPYNAITYSKSRQDLSGLRDWWYNESAESSSATSDNEAVRKATTDYSVDYKLESVKKRPATLTYVDKQYNLRPETIESLFIMYRITGDRKYQEYGWEVFQAIEKWCRTESGYASIRNVDVDPKNEYAMKNLKMDTMETFILAETFKYLYLLFSPADVVSLDKFVFNTEAHPFIRKKWNWDRIFNKKDE